MRPVVSSLVAPLGLWRWPSTHLRCGSQQLGVVHSVGGRSEKSASPLQESADFRPQHFTMSASMIGAALVLCNDRPETFGAPDVLEVRSRFQSEALRLGCG